LETEKKNVKG